MLRHCQYYNIFHTSEFYIPDIYISTRTVLLCDTWIRWIIQSRVNSLRRILNMFLGAFVKLRKVTIRFVMSLRTTRFPLDGFWWNLILKPFSKICQGKLSLFKIRQEELILCMNTFSLLWQYLRKLFLRWDMFQTKVVEKVKTHIFWSITVFRKSCRFWDNVEEFGRARETTNEDTIWRLRAARWTSEATRAQAHAPAHAPWHARTHKVKHLRAHTNTDRYVILFTFPLQKWFANAPQCYVVRTLPVLLTLLREHNSPFKVRLLK
jgi:hypothetical protein